ncbi:MAG: hypothetical protein IKY94_15495 [Lachnospiraceae bacterium]|nr:hypothetical protein [Lachnospiraceae bacterium]
MLAIDFLKAKNEMCNFYSKEGNGSCLKCPIYNSTWDCDHYCFLNPVDSVRVVKAWKERYGK